MLRESLLELDHELNVIPSAYALSIIAFKKIVDKYDTEKAQKILAYIYFMRDPRSSYSAYDEKKRHKEVCESVFGKDFKPCPLTKAALEEYVKTSSAAMLLLESAKESITTLKKWLKMVDPEDEDYDPAKHMRVLGDMGKTINGLKDLEEAVKKESEVNDTFGGVVVSKYNE